MRRFSYCLLILSALVAGCSKTVSTIAVDEKAPRSFAQRQVRYMTPVDLFELLARALPVTSPGLPGECYSTTDSNRGLIGDNVPSTGSPIFDQPTSNFVRWYARCLDYRLQAIALFGTDDAKPEILFGPTLAGRIAADEALTGSLFTGLPLLERRTMVLEQIEHMICPSEIVADFKYFESSEALADHLLSLLGPEMTVLDAAKRSLFLIALRDEFLSY